jgi:demethylmenaquinone methyltransferase / 2-methoxy-6-polyprenyl-1,4-benzoquinol methylase
MSKLQAIFTEVAPTYERANRILTLGFDRLWRRAAARRAVRGGGALYLDACCGTGNMAEELARRLPAGARVVAVDFNPAMMAGLRDKTAFGRNGAAVRADVGRLPFRPGTFDRVTISFATRNINVSPEILRNTLGEFRRVLKSGGLFVQVETSRPPFGPIRRAYFALVRRFVRPLGRFVSGSDAGYAYLASTIPRFYAPEDLAGILRQAGFAEVSFERRLFGAVAVHTAKT